MGCVKGIAFDQFPRQGDWVGKRTRVCFNYESRFIWGTVVRDDKTAPGLTIIRLDDGRHVLTTECQHSHPE